ncbi:MAG TPA: LCP family protein [Coleofasciculaceae cyanobacterium]|jgi:anionic cell wall polymer biosynthesis LytR-Cps2A-Psr (LCP) family protein
MNHERSRNRDKPSWQFENNAMTRAENQLKPTDLLKVKTVEQTPATNELKLLHQPWWFWSQHESWSHFSRGLFWGGIISLTAVSSALCGAALTKIDAIERTIAQKIEANSAPESAIDRPILNRPINVLLIEDTFDTNEMIEFPDTFIGNSKTILLLRFEPQLELAQVINLPLDSSTEIPGFGAGTIALAYELGGTNLLSKVVSQLMNDLTIDRYIRATPETFRQLIASGKITFQDCDPRIRDCSDNLEQIVRQSNTFEAIRQHLNIPNYMASFKTAIVEAESNLDTNISVPEIISLANFVEELEADSISVNLLPGYTPGKTIADSHQLDKFPSTQQKAKFSHSNIFAAKSHLQDNPVAVQNTTNNPQLAMQVIAYLRHRNFRDVYLVEHIPLKLNKTRIVAHRSQVKPAHYLQEILGFGNLETKSDLRPRELTLQIGKDALYLPTNYRSFN